MLASFVPEPEREAVQRALGFLLVLPVLSVLLAANSVLDQETGATCEQLLSRLTAAEKAGQMVIVYNTDIDFLREHNVGGIILFKPMVTDSLLLKRELEQKQRAMAIPLLVCIDQEGGTINRLGNLARFATTPAAVELTGLPDRVVRSNAAELTDFLLSVGININFAPCLDPARSLATGQPTYMADHQRSFGDSPALITRKAGAFLSGVSQAGGLAVVKHFPGYDAPQNSDQRLTVSPASAESIAQYMLPTIQGFVMSGHTAPWNAFVDAVSETHEKAAKRPKNGRRTLNGAHGQSPNSQCDQPRGPTLGSPMSPQLMVQSP